MNFVPIDTNPAERQRRADAVRAMLANLRLEGMEPTPDAQAIFQRFVDGELSLPETTEAIRTLNERYVGRPVPVSGNGRP